MTDITHPIVARLTQVTTLDQLHELDMAWNFEMTEHYHECDRSAQTLAEARILSDGGTTLIEYAFQMFREDAEAKQDEQDRDEYLAQQENAVELPLVRLGQGDFVQDFDDDDIPF